MYALLEVWNSEQDVNFVWLQDRVLGEAGSEGSAVLMSTKPYFKGNYPRYERIERWLAGWWKWVPIGIYEREVMGGREGAVGGWKRCLSRSRVWCSAWWSCCAGLEGSQRWQWGTEEDQLETNWKFFLKTVLDVSGSLAGSWMLEFMTLLQYLYHSLDAALRRKLLPVWMTVYPRLVVGVWKRREFLLPFAIAARMGKLGREESLEKKKKKNFGLLEMQKAQAEYVQ